MDSEKENGGKARADESPLRETVDFQKIKARWMELRAKYPKLDRAIGAVCGIRWSEVITTLRNRLIAGVVIAIPIIVTVWVLQIAFDFISRVSSPWLEALKIKAPQWGAFFVTLLVLLGLGFMATNVIGARIIEGAEKLMLKIPGVAPIFSATKQIIEAFKGISGPTSFQRVVYVEYPSPGCRLLGFVTGQFFDPTIGKEVTTVFLPTSPNPITGFVLVVDSALLIDAPLGLDEATKMLVSAGLVTPRDRMVGLSAAEAIANLGATSESGVDARVAVSTIEISKGGPPRLWSDSPRQDTPKQAAPQQEPTAGKDS